MKEKVRQNPDQYSIVAIEVKPGAIKYAQMAQAPSASLKKGRDNVKCPLDEDLSLSIDSNSSYVRVNWLTEVQREGDENDREEPNKKRFKICQVKGNQIPFQIQQREHEIFPTALIKVPLNFASTATNAGESSSLERLNFLGFSKQAFCRLILNSSKGVTKLDYEQDVMSVDFENLITVEEVKNMSEKKCRSR